MNNMNTVSAHPFIRDDYSNAESTAPTVKADWKTDWKTILDRILVLVSLTIIGFCLAIALNPHHFMLTGVFGWLGLWATNRLSAENSYRVAPALVFLNLVCWPEPFIALPIAALTVGLSQDFQVDESVREALRLSGLTGAAITLLCLLG